MATKKINFMYNVDYFIKKFQRIPKQLWCCGSLTKGGQHCALGHCGVTNEDIINEGTVDHEEGKALVNLLKIINTHYAEDYDIVYHINDNYGRNFYDLPHPKQRILAALYDIKSLQAVKEAETIIRSAGICTTDAVSDTTRMIVVQELGQ